MSYDFLHGQLAQSVEQRTENPRVPGSIPGLATIFIFNNIWRHGQVVRQRPAKPLSPVQIRVAPPRNSLHLCSEFFIYDIFN